MKILTCPLNGPRNISEFACGGEVILQPDPRDLEDTLGVVREWWCHTASSYWFIAERNTATDEILRTYPASELFEERVDFAPREETA